MGPGAVTAPSGKGGPAAEIIRPAAPWFSSACGSCRPPLTAPSGFAKGEPISIRRQRVIRAATASCSGFAGKERKHDRGLHQSQLQHDGYVAAFETSAAPSFPGLLKP